MSKHTRDELLYLAKLAEQCERYDGKIVTVYEPDITFDVWYRDG